MKIIGRVRELGEKIEWFQSKVRQGYVMSPWLIDSYLDDVVWEANAKAEGNGMNLVGVDGRGQELCQVLFADDTALVADSEDMLLKLVEEFGRVCERRKLKVNVNKSKGMHCSWQMDMGRCWRKRTISNIWGHMAGRKWKWMLA